MEEALAQALAAGLQIWQHKEKNKYSEELRDILEGKREEESKPENEINDAVLDKLKFRLRLLTTAFATEVGRTNP